jgi:hypothetical protein
MDNFNTGEYVYVVYWKDLDCDKIRKSTMEIVGVYTKEKEALTVAKSHNRRLGSCNNDSFSRNWLSNARIEKIELNKINLWTGDVWSDDEDSYEDEKYKLYIE